MRHATRSLLGALVVIGCCWQTTLAEESTSWWWPFGAKSESRTTVTPSPSPFTSTTAPALPPSPAITPVGPRSEAPSYMPPLSSHVRAPSTQQSQAAPPVADDTLFPQLAWPQWPQVSLPKPRMPQFWRLEQQVDDSRNAWARQSAAAARPSPLQSVRNGAHRVANNTKAAWRATVDTLTPGTASPPSRPQLARRDPEPPFWKRMMGAEPERREPQTMTDFVGQPRP